MPPQSLSKIIATVFFVGYIPFAPGTFGSLVAAIFIWTFRPDVLETVIILIAGFTIGVLVSNTTEKEFGQKDSKQIVIDEFVGYCVAIAFLPITIEYVIATFFLFRFFDILKPPPIRNIERMFSGGFGIMIDDVAAGVLTNIILQIVNIVITW
ncbi:phosphatidylglycerophosphatase A [Thermodesulfovibrionales bacterium]|nr:phosphatidylglycerophosphatase A [Thermodesulfovibrionales bacterium]